MTNLRIAKASSRRIREGVVTMFVIRLVTTSRTMYSHDVVTSSWRHHREMMVFSKALCRTAVFWDDVVLTSLQRLVTMLSRDAKTERKRMCLKQSDGCMPPV